MLLAFVTLFAAWSGAAAVAADGAANGDASAAHAESERFRVIERHCRFVRDDWRQFLFDDTRLIGVQPVAMPGHDTCALLVWRRPDDDTATDDAENAADRDGAVPFSSNCETPAELVWNDRGTQRTFPIPGSSYVTGARAVLDTHDSTPLLLVGTTGPNRCSIRETVLLSWNADDAAAPLQRVPADSEAARAHAAVCPDLWAHEVCTPEDGNAFVASFIDEHWNDEYSAFEAALLADDRPVLSALRARGLPPYWIRRAIDAVSSDTASSLAQRRRRTAWLFRQEQLGEALNAGVALALLPWLPAEDWTPVLNALKHDAKLLRLLHAEAQRSGRTATGCRIARALDTPDGEIDPSCKNKKK